MPPVPQNWRCILIGGYNQILHYCKHINTHWSPQFSTCVACCNKLWKIKKMEKRLWSLTMAWDHSQFMIGCYNQILRPLKHFNTDANKIYMMKHTSVATALAWANELTELQQKSPSWAVDDGLQFLWLHLALRLAWSSLELAELLACS